MPKPKWTNAVAARAMRVRRSFSGGRPLPRSLDAKGRATFARGFRSAVEDVPGTSNESKYRAIAAALSPPTTTAALYKLSSSQVGASPERSFALYEALNKAGVSWCSGIVGLSLVPQYQGHVLGVIGNCVLLGDARTLKPMWPAFFVFLKRLDAADNILTPGLKAYASTLSFGQQQRTLLRRAFKRWIVKEDDSKMLHSIRAYIAITKLTIDPAVVSGVLSIARATIESELINAHPSWGSHPDQPNELDLAEADRLFRNAR